MQRILSVLLVVFLVVLQAIPVHAATDKELAEMKKQMSALTDYVKSLEKRLAAQEKGAPTAAPAAAPADAAPAAPADPLAAMESNLGYSGGAPASGVRRAGMAAPAAAPAGSGDTLADMEQVLSVAKASASATQNPRTAFNPQISVIGDTVYRSSSIDEDPAAPDVNGNPQGDKNRDRFSLRELEIAFQAAIDPFSRADIYLAMPGVLEEIGDDIAAANEQKIEVEEAFITYWRLPYNLQLKAGKFRMEFGKNNRQHGHTLYGVERPEVITNFFGGDGLREQGLSLQTFIPIHGPGTQLELTGQVVNGEGGEETLFAGTGSDKLMGLAHVRLYHDINDSSNIDLGYSHLWGHNDPASQYRQRIRGLDVTYRYEPVAQAVYKQLIVRGEYLRGDRTTPVDLPVDADGDGVDDRSNDFVAHQKPDGFYLMAQYQWDRFWNVGVRYDETNPALRMADLARSLDPLVRDRANLTLDKLDVKTAYVTYLNSEFSQFRLEYQNRDTNFALDNSKMGEDRITAQWIWAMGPHGAHKY